MKLFRGGQLWSSAVYAQDEPFDTTTRLRDPIRLFDSRKLLLLGNHPHTQADPFLLVDGDTLYIFLEQMYRRQIGKIACYSTNDLENFQYRGIVLDRPFHLSFPFVFTDDGGHYMVPESQGAKEITLYRFERLPDRLVRARTLVTGLYADPVIIWRDGLYYLFATSSAGLEIFYSSSLLDGEFERHPLNPVTVDARYSRSGGSPVEIAGRMHRVSQDCSQGYGLNGSLIEILELSPTTYHERVVVPRLYDRHERWNRDGAHHLSVTRFKGRTVMASDGKHRDYWANKLLSRLVASPPTE